MIIAQIVCVYPPYKSGLGHAAQVFARQTAALGHKSLVITPDFRLPDQSQFKDPNVLVKRIRPWIKRGNGAFIPGLIKAIRGIDIAYLHYPFYGGQEILFFARILGLTKARIIIHYHMDTPGLDGLAKVLSLPGRLTSAALFNRAQLITSASLDYIDNSNIRFFYQSNQKKFKELPFAVDTDLFKPVERPSLPQNILFVGALDQAHAFKGLPVLMQAFKPLLGQGKRLRIVGQGDLKPRYEQMARDLGIARETIFLGKLSLPGLVKEYQNAGVLVLPSTGKNEAFGIVLIEAMSCGVPVVASNLPGVRYVLRNAITGYTATVNDPADFTNKIKEVLSDFGRWHLMSKAARELALERYSLDIFQKRLDEIYRSI